MLWNNFGLMTNIYSQQAFMPNMFSAPFFMPTFSMPMFNFSAFNMPVFNMPAFNMPNYGMNTCPSFNFYPQPSFPNFSNFQMPTYYYPQLTTTTNIFDFSSKPEKTKKEESVDTKTALGKFEKMEAKMKSMDIDEALKCKDKKYSVDMVNEEWRTMANNGDVKTEEKYIEFVKKFGKEYTSDIDKKFGNNDGTLTYSEFLKHQMADVENDADDEVKAEMKKSAKIAFNKLDINKDNKIDEKEITTLLAAMDYDEDNNVNGRITINDFARVSIQLAEKDDKDLDKLLDNRYNAFFNKKA